MTPQKDWWASSTSEQRCSPWQASNLRRSCRESLSPENMSPQNQLTRLDFEGEWTNAPIAHGPLRTASLSTSAISCPTFRTDRFFTTRWKLRAPVSGVASTSRENSTKSSQRSGNERHPRSSTIFPRTPTRPAIWRRMPASEILSDQCGRPSIRILKRLLMSHSFQRGYSTTLPVSTT